MKAMPVQTALLILLGLGSAGSVVSAAAKAAKPIAAMPAQAPLWITAYYPVWHQRDADLTPQNIDYTAFSHLIHFALIPKSDGTLDSSGPDGITPAESKAVIAPAHAKGRKVLICLGGENTASQFRAVLPDPIRPTLIHSIVQFVTTRGYDGVDIDMEPIEDTDRVNYAKFIHELRAQLKVANTKLLLTAAISSEPTLFARLKDDFDQINVMTYDMSGAWPGWETWYNAPLSNGGRKMMSSGEPLPSVQQTVQEYLKAGVPRAKLGIGVAFYGDVWSGATGPEQSIQGVTVNDSVDYRAIMDTYYQPERYHWDSLAHSPYLSIDSPDPKQRKFISYDDEKLCREKVIYARQHRLGGLIIWELGGDYRASQPPGQREVLLQSVKTAWLAGKESARQNQNSSR